ncbi:hypothetical protein ACP70R_048666 [Stipagrostis hirtigluma subsp. patula]
MGRGYDYSPSPPRGYRRRARSPSPRGHYGGRSRDLPTSLLVRNLRRDCRPDDLRRPFGKFGRLKDIYLPRDYYTGDPRGFGFIQYYDPEDAADAKYHMDGQLFLGREITVVFAEENRKKPSEMRAREKVIAEAVPMTGGRAQGRLHIPTLQGVDHGPAAEATHRHLSEIIIQGRALPVRDLCRSLQWAADQGVQALP